MWYIGRNMEIFQKLLNKIRIKTRVIYAYENWINKWIKVDYISLHEVESMNYDLLSLSNKHMSYLKHYFSAWNGRPVSYPSMKSFVIFTYYHPY